MEKTGFSYVIYIAAPQEKVWKALVDPESTLAYWQHVNLSDWKPGSKWEHRDGGATGHLDLVGKVLEAEAPRSLVLAWADPGDADREERYSRVRFELEAFRALTRLSLTHDRLEAGSEMLEGIVDGWPKVLSSLKSLLETGKALPRLW